MEIDFKKYFVDSEEYVYSSLKEIKKTTICSFVVLITIHSPMLVHQVMDEEYQECKNPVVQDDAV